MRLEVWRQPVATSVRHCVWRGRLVAGYAAGAAVPRLPTYCTYEDMLEFGPWVKYLPAASEQAAFYKPRLEARLWIDDLIVRSDRGGGLFPFGSAGVPYWQWSGWMSARKSPMPAVWTRDQLWGGFVLRARDGDESGLGLPVGAGRHRAAAAAVGLAAGGPAAGGGADFGPCSTATAGSAPCWSSMTGSAILRGCP